MMNCNKFQLLTNQRNQQKEKYAVFVFKPVSEELYLEYLSSMKVMNRDPSSHKGKSAEKGCVGWLVGY